MKCKPWKMVRGRKKSVDQSVGREVFALKSTKYDNAANALTKITNFSGRHCCYSHYRFTLYFFFSFVLACISSFLLILSFSFILYCVCQICSFSSLHFSHGLCRPAAAGSCSPKVSLHLYFTWLRSFDKFISSKFYEFNERKTKGKERERGISMVSRANALHSMFMQQMSLIKVYCIITLLQTTNRNRASSLQLFFWFYFLEYYRMNSC